VTPKVLTASLIIRYRSVVTDLVVSALSGADGAISASQMWTDEIGAVGD
jgi:hypothetical protein